MMNQSKWAARLACAAAAALLAACGGSDQTTAASTSGNALVLRAEGQSMPSTMVMEAQSLKTRDSALAPTPSKVRLGALAQTMAQETSGTGPRQISLARAVAATSTVAQMQQQWKWQPTAQGGQVAAVSYTAEGAYGLRLGVWVESLPAGTVLRVYSQERPSAVYQISGQEVLQRLQRNVDAGDTSSAARTWWTPDTGTPETTLEVELPKGASPADVKMAVGQLSHVYANLSIPTESEMEQVKAGESDSCNLDATCYDAYANQRNAVARMVYIKDGGGYLCTGTLLNDIAGSGTPYFLSANHCISSQTVASTLETNWFYRSPSCNSGTLSASSVRRIGGADLLFASGSTDVSFMRLRETPPAGVYFAGWDASSVATGTAVVGVHHPHGDLQKISFGSLQGQTSCTAPDADGNYSCSGSSGNYHRVTWSQGTVQGGSSGSALFSQGKYVVGNLLGGNASCTNLGGTNTYGRFDLSYSAALHQWLNNGGSGGSTRVPVYRFYNTSGMEHYYTANAAERDLLVNQYASNFIYEGVNFYAYGSATSGMFPVYRLVNTDRKMHLYTSSAAERDAQLASFSAVANEGTAWYAQAQAGNGAKPMYRFFNKATNTYFYTFSEADRADIAANHSAQYISEGVGFYIWSSQ